MRAVLLCCLLWALPAAVWADRARPPRDYALEVAQGRYVFVMLATRSSPLDPGAPDDVGVLDPDEALRKTYKASGLYPAGQTTPLWTVPWYAFEVFPAPDGEHLVRLGPWASSTEQLALAFYSRGNELKRYLIQDLVKNPDRLRHTVSHFFWKKQHQLDAKAGVFRLDTVDCRSYRFSLQSGEILP